MKAPLSWIKDYIDLDDLNIEEIAKTLTALGLEVDGVHLVGLPMPPGETHEVKYSGLSWEPDKIVVGEVREVLPHPNADRLVLCKLRDGQGEHIVLTGAPNLYPYKGQGELEKPLKVAYARQGAMLYDGHQPGQVLTKLKPAVIRGIESSSMICSEKELGISEEHEGIIFLDENAPVGMPLAEYMGDAVIEINILPNVARDAAIIGIARELSAALNRELRLPEGVKLDQAGEIETLIGLEIQNAEFNPRFMLGMLEGSQPVESPYWVRHRLTLAGMRPIDALVDATNYTMLDTGQPLHAFDYDLLKERAKGAKPTIITRPACAGEELTMLDGTELKLDDQMELVTDTAGPLSLAGVMGGSETGVNAQTKRVLIEAASWNFINIRRTLSKTKINSEAGYRFSRDVHPALAEQALSLCLRRMLEWGGGRLVSGYLDVYPYPIQDPVISLTEKDISKLLGVRIPLEEAADILRRLKFKVEPKGEELVVTAPNTRRDIEEGLIGKANLIEEVSRIYGYDRIPAKRLSSELPPQRGNPELEAEEHIRDLLISMGLQDTFAYRQTSVEREARMNPGKLVDPQKKYVRIKNPVTPDRSVMRTSALSTMLELLEWNGGYRSGLAMFELGIVFLPVEGQVLPREAKRLSIGLTGSWEEPAWRKDSDEEMDFFDLKGIVEALLEGLHVPDVIFEPAPLPVFHPGRCAKVLSGEKVLGFMGEVHPEVRENYDFPPAAVLAAEFDLDELIQISQTYFENKPISAFPAVYEDIAVIVDETTPASDIQAAILRAGGKLLISSRLFDIFRGERIGAGKKSMAYQLVYQASDRTLTDKDAETIRNRIVRQLARDFSAVLRSK
ncbi:MAG: phenylalanine--tRNA ligase subunit beta [Anaerolineaceae bacterium]|jgi:phenylalanyl-tRNA synthetase beta chain